MRQWSYQVSYDNWYSPQHTISWAIMELQDCITTSNGSIIGKNRRKTVQVMYANARIVSRFPSKANIMLTQT